MFLEDRIYWDFHVGAEPDSVSEWESFIINFELLLNEYNSKMQFVILEENGDDHGLLRGLGHATYNNMFIRHSNIGKVHGYANAIEAWQGMDSEEAFPQGQIFYTSDISFGQTTLYTNQIWKKTFPKYPKIGKKIENINVKVVNGSNSNINQFDIASKISVRKHQK